MSNVSAVYFLFYTLNRVYLVCHEVFNTQKETSETLQNIYIIDHPEEPCPSICTTVYMRTGPLVLEISSRNFAHILF